MQATYFHSPHGRRDEESELLRLVGHKQDEPVSAMYNDIALTSSPFCVSGRKALDYFRLFVHR